MYWIKPTVTLLARSEIRQDGVDAFLSLLGAESTDLPAASTPGDALSLIAGKTCYLSFKVGLNENITQVRGDVEQYIEHILSSRHGSVLEHITYTFGINGVSSVFTAEMNRHRAGWAVSEQSGRFVRRSHLPVTLPDSLEILGTDTEEMMHKKLRTIDIFQDIFTAQEAALKAITDLWEVDNPDMKMKEKKKITSMMRRIVGKGAATGGVWTGNLRALRHVLALRATPEAEEEICAVAMKIFDIMKLCEPHIFGDFEKTDEMFLTPNYWKV